MKHAVLPFFMAVHAGSIYACTDLQLWAKLIGRGDDVGDGDKQSILYNHMLGCLLGFNVAMLTLCSWGVFSKASHSDTRQAIAVAETAFFAVVAYDAYKSGELNATVPAAHSLLALVGSIVSYMEPGIFTKDHGTDKKSQ